MTAHNFALFDTAIGRCAIAWGARGVVGVQLPEGGEARTRARMSASTSNASPGTSASPSLSASGQPRAIQEK